EGTKIHLLPFIGILLTLSAAYRLAKFNIDTRQTTSFIGLPTPAMALFILALPLILKYNDNESINTLILNKYFLIVITIVLSLLMHANVKLFSLKMKNFTLKKNMVEVVFLVLSLMALLVFKFVAIPLIIILYLALSLVSNLTR
ncbi:MAG: phosphatidylserine synthase, partial [Bacteroidia bacterium]|nr:phosphatidylserine synthase [Bacteroidia bacterium]